MADAFSAIMELVVERARVLTGAAGATVELADGDEMIYAAVSGTLTGTVGMRLQRASSLSGLCVAERRVLYAENTATDPRVDRAACQRVGAVSMICVPLRHDDAAVGVLKVIATEPCAFGSEVIHTLELLADLIAAAISNSQVLRDAQRDSRHDALTGLPNRRSFDERLAAELDRHRRHALALSLALLDLDGFKRANDTYGHAEGDAVLRDFASLLRRELRRADEPFRTGGDEFAILFANTPFEGARIALTRVVAGLHETRLGRGLVGVSYGLVEASGDDPAALCARADADLYVQKRAKRQQR